MREIQAHTHRITGHHLVEGTGVKENRLGSAVGGAGKRRAHAWDG